MAERLADRLARLERERQEADQLYNDALTALDRALQSLQALPSPPPAYDPSKLPEINDAWDILPGGPPVFDRSLKGRLGGFVWRLIGPAIDRQRRFNAGLVDHLNRNVAAHQDAQDATARTIAALDAHLRGQVVFQSHLIHLLQQVTRYIDSRSRVAAAGHEVLNAGLSAISDTWLKRWESLDAREARIGQRLSSIDDLRATATLAQQTALSLKRDVEQLVTGAAPARAAARETPAVAPVKAPDPRPPGPRHRT